MAGGHRLPHRILKGTGGVRAVMGPVDGPRGARLRIGSPVRGGGLRPTGFGGAAGGLFIPGPERALRVINLKSLPNRLIAGALWSFG